MINTFIYFTENVFPKYALIFQIFQKFGNFLYFFGLFQFRFLVKTYMEYSQTWQLKNAVKYNLHKVCLALKNTEKVTQELCF